MSASSDKLPPVPSQSPLADPARPSYFGATWSQWFTQVKAKVDIINASLVGMSSISGTGLTIRTGTGWITRSIQGTTGEIEILNGDGVGGNPTAQLANTAVTPGSYTNTNLTVDTFGRITAASNGSSSGGGGGKILQVVYKEMSTIFTTSDSSIPLDNTIPQITEGVEITDLTTAFTPTDATSIILVTLSLPWVAGSSSSIGIRITGFFGDGPDANFATSFVTLGNFPLVISFKVPAVDTTTRNISFRCGVSSGTFYINRTAATPSAFGGVMKALLTIQELTP